MIIRKRFSGERMLITGYNCRENNPASLQARNNRGLFAVSSGQRRADPNMADKEPERHGIYKNRRSCP